MITATTICQKKWIRTIYVLEKILKLPKKKFLKESGSVEITHFLWVLDAHPELLDGKIEKPLTGVKVAPYYGCHILRPQEIMNYEDGKHPQSVDILPTSFSFKVLTCQISWLRRFCTFWFLRDCLGDSKRRKNRRPHKFRNQCISIRRWNIPKSRRHVRFA